ncbi:MAG TPA: hypothetical protein VIJ39_09065 [Solirubrobacteraceae bacterium]
MLLLVLSTGAQAAVTHAYLSQITEVPDEPGVTDPGALGKMESMTVDSGHLWVAEVLNGASRVDEFNDSTGAFISQFILPASLSFKSEGGIAIGHATGEAEVYVTATTSTGEAAIAVFDEAGTLQATWTGADTPEGSFGAELGATDVAVDASTSLSDTASGDVYVALPERRVIDVFHPEVNGKEKYVAQLTGISPSEPFGFPFKLAVDSINGDVVARDRESVDMFEPGALGEYTFARTLSRPGGFHGIYNVAVDEGNGEIYVTDGFAPTAIDEFGPAGAYVGRFTGVDSPGGNIEDVYSLAADPVSHHVYVADNRSVGGRAVKIFGVGFVIPDVSTRAATELKALGATLNGTVNPDKAGEATCQFDWGTTTEFGQVAQCSGPVVEGESAVAVRASLGGLEPDTEYCYRLEASDANGVNAGESFEDRCFKTPGPGLGTESISFITAESATFDATIDPDGAPTRYYFQYGTSAAYGLTIPSPPGSSLGSGNGYVEVGEHVQNLTANTIYHYRVVRVSEIEPGKVEEFDGPDQTFTTQRVGVVPAIPDGRSWELVTPPDKHGALFYGYDTIRGEIQASVDGNAIASVASQPSESDPEGSSNEVSVLSSRGAGGWASQVLSPPHDEATGVNVGEIGDEYRFFSEDLSTGVLQPFGNFKALSPQATESTAYLHSNYTNGDVTQHCKSACYQPLVTASNTPPGTEFGQKINGAKEVNGECGPKVVICGPLFLDATPDLKHILVSSYVQLTETPIIDQSEGAEGLYEWTEGKLQIANILPPDEERAAGLAGIFLAHSAALQTGTGRAISSDGRYVVLVAGKNEPEDLYLRDMRQEETVRIDKPEVAGGTSVKPIYMTANTEDSRIFFLDSGRLTANAEAIGKPQLYEYDTNQPEGFHLKDLTVDPNAGEAAQAEGVLGVSENGSYVYFDAAGALTANAEPSKCEYYLAKATKTEMQTCNVYVYHDGVTRFIGAAGAELLDARVSPGGNWLAFMSDRDLTGYDTRDAVSGHLDQEVYLYDASAEKLVCASCNPTGARPAGLNTENINGKEAFENAGDSSNALSSWWVAAGVPHWTRFSGEGTLYQPRYLSDSGRLFFNSSEGLVPNDVNGTIDVYEYEPPGVGDCTQASATYGQRSGGCVGLISSGSSPEESTFLDASGRGEDVFFLTLAKLVAQDYDQAIDVYDAHECSAVAPCFPAPPVLPPVCDTGDACKAAPTPQPSIFGEPSSATFSGVGNVSAAPATKVTPKRLSRSQKLAAALRTCQRDRKRARRAACERVARGRYGPVRPKGKQVKGRSGR